jgi:hypothetical protein
MFGVTFISPSLAPRSSLAGGEGVRPPSSGNLQNLPISVCLSHGANVSCLHADSEQLVDSSDPSAPSAERQHLTAAQSADMLSTRCLSTAGQPPSYPLQLLNVARVYFTTLSVSRIM